MARLSAALVVVCLTTCLLGVNGKAKVVRTGDVETMDWNDYLQYVCTNGYTVFPSNLCNPYTSTTTKMTTPATPTATTTPTTQENGDDNGPVTVSSKTSSTGTPTTTQSSSSSSSASSIVSGSTLEQAHWCKFSNGSYLSLGQTFIYNRCSVCQCIQSRAIRCATLQCMNTYCIDGSTPVTRDGQCCQQCTYENSSTSCVVNGITFPTGTLLRQTTDSIQCWCQLGTVECRKSSGSALSSLDYFGDGTAVYVLVIVICIVLGLGTLLCCGGGLFFYYYYYNRQHAAQDAYAQYYGTAGWQPMSEDGQVIVDGVAQEKQAEAEQQQYEEQYPAEQSAEYVPPPYAMYNGSHLNSQNEKEQRFA